MVQLADENLDNSSYDLTWKVFAGNSYWVWILRWTGQQFFLSIGNSTFRPGTIFVIDVVMNENALIQAAMQGDLDGFNQLVLTHQDLAYHQAFRLLGDQDAAEDVVQEAFLLAYQHLHSFRGGSFRAWIVRIVTNLCYDELRRRKSRPSLPLEPLDANDEEIESPSWIVDTGELPEAAVERGELDQVIRNSLNELSPDLRAVVVLVDIQGFDYVEAAQALGVPLGTIKSRLARARLRLRNSLQESGDLLPASLLGIGRQKQAVNVPSCR